MKRLSRALLIALAAAMLTACSRGPSGGGDNRTDGTAEPADIGSIDLGFTDRDGDGSYDESEATIINLSDSGSMVFGTGAAADDSGVTVSSAGAYVISGTLSDGRITVSAGESDKVQLVLKNVSVTCSSGAAIVIGTAKKVFITLDGENTLSDGAARAEDDTKADGAVYSKADLTINGSGSLSVSGSYKHGIVSKDDLVVTGGNITVKAAKAGLCGKDCVKISGGSIKVDAGSDAIRSDNAENASRGYVYICGGTLDLTSGNDGIQAVTLLEVAGGEINIVSGGGSANAVTERNDRPGGFPGGGRPGRDTGRTETDEESAKGLKSDSALTVSGGSVTIDSKDDGIHSNGSVSVTDGVIRISSGDDGIHADKSLSVSGGEITVEKSYEGLESADISLSGGRISVTASDDGINASDGSGNSMMGRAQDVSLVISGGYIFVDAGGDGIDSNGAINVTGGVTLVSGPTSDGDGALDYETGAAVTGGILIAAGSSGMAEGFTSAEGQGAMLVKISPQTAGTSLVLCDSDGMAIVSFTPKKQYSSVVITAPGITSGSTYTLLTGAAVSGADINGYALNPEYSGGSPAAEVEMTSGIYGSSGTSGFRPGRR